ncbi:hypothetical protein CISIN_1g0476071mg, partial [Citrus sinensis]
LYIPLETNIHQAEVIPNSSNC